MLLKTGGKPGLEKKMICSRIPVRIETSAEITVHSVRTRLITNFWRNTTMTKRRTFIALAILILLGVGVVYLQQNYEITRKIPEVTESEIEEAPETKPKLTDAELADYRYRQSLKYMREIDTDDPESLDKFLNSAIHKEIVAKVKSPDEIFAELSALSDEEWQIQRKKFNEKMAKERKRWEAEGNTPALSPLEIRQKFEQGMRENKQKFEQHLREHKEWNKEIDRRLQWYLKVIRENPEIFEDNLDVPTHPERNAVTNAVTPVKTFSEPNKPPDNNPWNEVITEWDNTLKDDYRDLFIETDKEARDAFSQQLPTEDARKYYESRQAELHNQYATRIRAQLTKIPPEKRTEAMERIRQELSRTWDADFVNAVTRLLQQKN